VTLYKTFFFFGGNFTVNHIPRKGISVQAIHLYHVKYNQMKLVQNIFSMSKGLAKNGLQLCNRQEKIQYGKLKMGYL
jgi:hypothetical protein